jgi:hypothetical protein
VPLSIFRPAPALYTLPLLAQYSGARALSKFSRALNASIVAKLPASVRFRSMWLPNCKDEENLTVPAPEYVSPSWRPSGLDTLMP